jgi:hypothetical protein
LLAFLSPSIAKRFNRLRSVDRSARVRRAS